VFVAYLLQNVGRIMVDAKARNILVKQLASKNVNQACKTALQPHKQRATLQEMIRCQAQSHPGYSCCLKGNVLPWGKKRRSMISLYKRRTFF
jgi:hypothetical protein